MITLRVMAGAFLENGGDWLMLRRSDDRAFYPGLWSGVGGHVEAAEINDPRRACLREIAEETGIGEHDVSGLALRYIVLRRKENEIRVTYVYFGGVNTREFTDCDEGRLYWVAGDTLLDRPMSAMNRLALLRYLSYGPEKDVLVGTLVETGGEPEMRWSPLAAWDGL